MLLTTFTINNIYYKPTHATVALWTIFFFTTTLARHSVINIANNLSVQSTHFCITYWPAFCIDQLYWKFRLYRHKLNYRVRTDTIVCSCTLACGWIIVEYKYIYMTAESNAQRHRGVNRKMIIMADPSCTRHFPAQCGRNHMPRSKLPNPPFCLEIRFRGAILYQKYYVYRPLKNTLG